ncbi:MAG: FecR family protein [Methylacidiphilales bacterium]|nr:FecR family protein [Candidatus Methylacidiphilales bacterium]
MKLRTYLSITAASLLITGHSVAATGKVATVTQAVNDVSHGFSQSTATSPAPTGTQIRDGEYLKTGSASRAELEFSNKTISRLGSNTIFNYSASSNEVDLQAGTILFSKPKNGQQLNIKTEAVTAAIVGTTGFLQVLHQNGHTTTLFGLVEGHANVAAGGNDPVIGPGQIFSYTPGSPPQIFNFNVPLFLRTALLYKGFKSTLPNQSYINAEVAFFNNLADRGFIGNPPPNLGFPLAGFDSVGKANSNSILSQQPSPPTPPPPPDRCCHPRCCRHGSS